MPLRQLEVEWSREEGLVDLEQVARSLVAEAPANAWAGAVLIALGVALEIAGIVLGHRK